jgi:hypothetical protein
MDKQITYYEVNLIKRLFKGHLVFYYPSSMMNKD